MKEERPGRGERTPRVQAPATYFLPMRLSNTRWTFSPTDLATFVRCEHAIHLRKGFREGTLRPLAERGKSLRSDMLARRGHEHEEKYLATLETSGKRIVEISREDPNNVAATLQAMREGADVIVQAALADDTWFGYADVLERVETPSTLGDWSYEAADTKLSMSVQPHFILQLGIYSKLIEAVQGTPPKMMHIILGDGSRHGFACHDFAAYLDRVIGRFQASFDSSTETLPYPVEYCALCEWNRHCWVHLKKLDHLSLVANIRRDHVKQLQTAGLGTLTALGEANPSERIETISAATFETLHHQARLQLEYERTKKHRYEFLEPEAQRGFELLPRPSPGDLFFDVEADPFEDLTYLFGIAYLDDGATQYRAWWAHDPDSERRAFKAVVDFITERRTTFPDAHIYHYGAIEVTTLKKLMGRYATREDEIDNFLRQQVFVDLSSVVKRSIRISHPSYSLKKVETFYFERLAEGVIDGGGAIVAYEEWLQEPTQAKLDEIEAYNREDCLSTVELQTWLLRLRSELERERGIQLAWKKLSEAKPTSEEAELERMETDALSSTLLSGLPSDRATWDAGQRAQWLLANLLHYHRREDKPTWWSYFDRLKMSAEELIDDRAAIGDLTPTGRTRQVKSSVAIEFRFAPQQHRFSVGKGALNPHRMKENDKPEKAGTIESLDEDAGLLELCRKEEFPPGTVPRAIVPEGALDTRAIRAALRRLTQTAIDGGFGGSHYRAAIDVLLRRAPRLHGQGAGAPLHGPHVDSELAQSLARRLDDSYLFIQGPPGSGKTYVGARIVVDLISAGKRIAITANSHKAIENMLHEVERVAEERNARFHGLKHSTDPSDAFQSKLASPHILDTSAKFERGQKPDPTDLNFRLVAGTVWPFSTPKHDQQFDVLVIDEAGQMSLANALAASTAARNLILLGDPQQLAQVSQGSHPDGCELSVLEHLLGDAATIPPERGIFLERSWRMHPDVCRFISDVVYEGRLESEEHCALRGVDAPAITGTGLRYHPVDHEGNSQASREEADWIAQTIAAMLNGGRFTNKDQTTRPLQPQDILVVTPYNAQVTMIRHLFQKHGLDVPVGTVDKFQGQEAPVVFFSLATSSSDTIPRSLDFLFSRNRLNVAISRAQCLAILVASPRLLDVECRTVEQMKLVNALCRFVEMATAI
jgi:predicted RecB family nuclease